MKDFPSSSPLPFVASQKSIDTFLFSFTMLPVMDMLLVMMMTIWLTCSSENRMNRLITLELPEDKVFEVGLITLMISLNWFGGLAREFGFGVLSPSLAKPRNQNVSPNLSLNLPIHPICHEVCPQIHHQIWWFTKFATKFGDSLNSSPNLVINWSPNSVIHQI